MTFEDKLIECIQMYTFLFDVSNACYRNKEKKNMAWAEIAMKLNSTANKCQLRWRSLRDTYRRYNNMVKDSCQWKYYKKLSFLENYKYIRGKDTNTHKGLKKRPMEDTEGFYEELSNSSLKKEPEQLDLANSNNGYDSDASSVHAKVEGVKIDVPTSSKTAFLQAYMHPAAAKTPKKRKHRDDSIEREILKLLNEAGEQFRSKSTTDESSTKKLFDSLATKIDNAQLPLEALNRFEEKLLKLVHTTLEENLKTD